MASNSAPREVGSVAPLVFYVCNSSKRPVVIGIDLRDVNININLRYASGRCANFNPVFAVLANLDSDLFDNGSPFKKYQIRFACTISYKDVIHKLDYDASPIGEGQPAGCIRRQLGLPIQSLIPSTCCVSCKFGTISSKPSPGLNETTLSANALGPRQTATPSNSCVLCNLKNSVLPE